MKRKILEFIVAFLFNGIIFSLIHLVIDNDYTLETKSTNKAPYSRPPSKFAGDYKVFQALEKTNVKPPLKK